MFTKNSTETVHLTPRYTGQYNERKYSLIFHPHKCKTVFFEAAFSKETMELSGRSTVFLMLY